VLPDLRVPQEAFVLGHGWQVQWERVHRLDDLRGVYTGRPGGTPAAVDAAQAFFEAVHHLKDWLGNDPSSGLTKADGDSLINASPVLQLCADLGHRVGGAALHRDMMHSG
jgi:hypothetical protein